MALYRVQSSLQDVSGLSEDRYVNTMYAGSAAPLAAENIQALAQFMSNTIGTLSTWYSKLVSGPGSTVKAYDMADIEPRPIRGEITHTQSVITSESNLPKEVAMCLTLNCANVPGVRRQSTHGRIFLGPLNVSTMETVSDNPETESTPAVAFRTAVVAAFVQMASDWKAQGATLAVASRKHNAWYPVITMSADNAWDTMRSRGNRPTSKVFGTIPGGGGSGGSW